jgi:S-formylglutathione hydrolase
MQTVSTNRSYGGTQGVYKHASRETGTDMVFSVYVPPHPDGAKLPVVWYLSGLTCTHANVTEKGEFRSACAELGLIFVAPDTSPRGEGVPGDPAKAYDFGLGAGFYVDATQSPFDRHYRMWSYVTAELPELVAAQFPVDPKRQSILGHSMGGHGALTAALRYPDRYRAASALIPLGYQGARRLSRRRQASLAPARYRGVDRGRCQIFGSAGGLRRRRSVSRRTASSRIAAGRLRQSRHSPHLAPSGRLRSQLLLHLHLHGRPLALARHTPEGLNSAETVAGAERHRRVRTDRAPIR